MSMGGQRKILMILPSPFFADRGCHVRIYEEIKALAKKGQRVRLVTYHNGRDLPGIDLARIPRVPWYRKEDAGPSAHKLYLDLLLLLEVCRQMLVFKPDILHAHLHEGAFIGLLVKKIFAKPLVFDFQGSLLAELNDHGVARHGLLKKMVAAVEDWINRGSDLILTSSNNARLLLLNDFGLTADKVVNLPDGIDPDRELPPGEGVRTRLGIGPGEKLVVYMGTLNELEGADLLVKIAAQLKNAERPIRFLVIGYPNAEHYRSLAEAAGVGHLMHFAGRMRHEETFAHLVAADIAVSPKIARTEGNLKLCYYMQCGLPTVVFDNEVNRELLGDCGFYAEFGNWRQMAGIIEKIADGGLVYDKEQIRRQVLRNFSMDTLVQIIEQGYDAIAGKK